MLNIAITVRSSVSPITDAASEPSAMRNVQPLQLNSKIMLPGPAQSWRDCVAPLGLDDACFEGLPPAQNSGPLAVYLVRDAKIRGHQRASEGIRGRPRGRPRSSEHVRGFRGLDHILLRPAKVTADHANALARLLLESRTRCGEHLHARQVISGNQRPRAGAPAQCPASLEGFVRT